MASVSERNSRVSTGRTYVTLNATITVALQNARSLVLLYDAGPYGGERDWLSVIILPIIECPVGVAVVYIRYDGLAAAAARPQRGQPVEHVLGLARIGLGRNPFEEAVLARRGAASSLIAANGQPTLRHWIVRNGVDKHVDCVGRRALPRALLKERVRREERRLARVHLDANLRVYLAHGGFEEALAESTRKPIRSYHRAGVIRWRRTG